MFDMHINHVRTSWARPWVQRSGNTISANRPNPVSKITNLASMSSICMHIFLVNLLVQTWASTKPNTFKITWRARKGEKKITSIKLSVTSSPTQTNKYIYPKIKKRKMVKSRNTNNSRTIIILSYHPICREAHEFPRSFPLLV